MTSYRMLSIALALLWAAEAAPAPAPERTPVSSTEAPVVRMVYIIPSDRVYRANYEISMAEAIEQLRAWYREQTGNTKTFAIEKRVVQVVHSTHPASWFASTPVFGADQSLWFWFNATSEASALTDARFDDPNTRWPLYIDADPLCGQTTGAAAGVALLPANDLRGLAGEVTIQPCGGSPEGPNLCRWVGGLGHELGHTFGLPHPQGCVGGRYDSSLMCLGYLTFPHTALLPADTVLLNASPFFAPTKNHKYDSKKFGCPLTLRKSRSSMPDAP